MYIMFRLDFERKRTTRSRCGQLFILKSESSFLYLERPNRSAHNILKGFKATHLCFTASVRQYYGEDVIISKIESNSLIVLFVPLFGYRYFQIRFVW